MSVRKFSRGLAADFDRALIAGRDLPWSDQDQFTGVQRGHAPGSRDNEIGVSEITIDSSLELLGAGRETGACPTTPG
jgi:hypothetical protein